MGEIKNVIGVLSTGKGLGKDGVHSETFWWKVSITLYKRYGEKRRYRKNEIKQSVVFTRKEISSPLRTTEELFNTEYTHILNQAYDSMNRDQLLRVLRELNISPKLMSVNSGEHSSLCSDTKPANEGV
ncbi:hypothetical protein Trydic_g16678 [Trypoxylus dichotomus]